MVKKILFLFTFMFITTINVNAQVLGTPLTSVDYLDNTNDQGNATIGTWWNTEYYVAPFRIGYFTSATAEANKIAFYWGGANLCTGQNLKISGQIGGLFNFFRDNSYSFNFINNNQNMTCAIEYQDPSRIGFTCVGVGGGDLYIAVNQHSFTSRENYEIGIRRDFDLSCDASNLQILQQDIINTQNIINSQNTNTQNIIANNNQTSQNIINNQNQNTQDIIDNQNSNTNSINENITDVFGNVCNYNYFNKDNLENGYYTANGVKTLDNGFNKITKDFIEMSPNTSISYSANKKIYSLTIYEFDANQNWIKRTALTQSSSLSVLNFTTSSNTKYIKLGVNYNQSSIITQEILNSLEIELVLGSSRVPYSSTPNMCYNKLDDQTNAINGLNDSITSDNPPDTTNAINSFNQSLADDTPITNLLTLPLTLINAYNQGINAVCSPYNLGNLYGTNIVLPCINLEQILGSNLWYTIDSLCCIFLIYSIAMLFVHAFDSLTSLKDDFDGMYVPKHAGKHVGSGLDG